jgi:hypothetical protein
LLDYKRLESSFGKRMSKDELNIDTSNHQRVPSTTERIIHSLLAIFLSFVLIQLIGFWMFPGIGIGGLYMFSAAHSMVAFIADITNIIIIAFMAICGLAGWFRGKYFTDRLKGYLSYWKFW